ncbi:MAG: DoxX family protein [Actinomycetota bacterium]|nr:DoxX family protein [Actinomycetota bacterium]
MGPATASHPNRASRRLAAVLAGDAVFDTIAKGWVQDDLDRLRLPRSTVRVIIAAKVAAAAGLLAGERRRPLGRLASAGVVLYFVLAVGAHVRARDDAWRYVAAVGMLGWAAQVYRAVRRSS